MKMNLKIIFILAFFLSIFSSNILFVSASELEDNLDVDFHSVSVIRQGTIFPASLKITNMNENEILEIKKVTILNDKKKIIKIQNINKNFKPLKTSFKRGKELIDYLRKSEFIENPELVKEQPEYQEYLDIYSEVKSETFRQSFSLDIRDFDSNPEIGDVVNVSIEIEIKIGNEKFTISKENLIDIAPPLPSPPHNSPGWYKGDLHIHSDFGETIWTVLLGLDDMDPLDEMVDAAINKNLDWVIFTDHSPAFSEASEWEAGYSACTGNSTGSFKCLYGQELSIGDTGICDGLENGHYLAYPSTDDNLSWIDGYCSVLGCNCRSEQPVMNEVNNAGGIGSIAHPQKPWVWNIPPNHYNWDNWSTTGFSGLEIINWGFSSDDATTINNPGGDDDSWREFLESETNPNDGFTVGTAGSDAHTTDDVGFGAFVYCYLDSLTTTNIRNAVKNGNCVTSSGPFVEFTLDGNIIGSVVNVSNGTNTISVTANSTGFGNLEWLYIYVDDQLTKLISLSGTSYSDTIDLDLDTSDNYIRLEVYTSETSDKNRAFTNPIWVNVATCSVGSWSINSCGAGSCNSEQKQWTRTSTPSGCAIETQCVFDASCEEGQGDPTSCNETGYEFCTEFTFGDCDVSIAANYYDNVNNISWGVVNDSWDPYVIDEYRIGWKGVDTKLMYYNVTDPNNDCGDGGCNTGESVSEPDTRVTVNSSGTASSEVVLGYDDTVSFWCTVWFNDFEPNYGTSNPIYVLNCFDNSDCSANQYCNKTGSWSNWDCVSDKSDGQSCASDAQCNSGYCDDDGVGLSDDGWCFTPNNTYFDGQETSYCEYSTGFGNSNCDERQVGDDLNLCMGTSYYEEECSSSCSETDVTSVFECSDAGCSCSEFLCDGLTTGSNITTCSSNQTYFADKCTSIASGEDRSDNVCRSSDFDGSCSADSQCNGVVAGTGDCNSSCNFVLPDDTHKFYVRNSTNDAVAWLGSEGNIVLKGNCYSGGTCTTNDGNSFIVSNSTDSTVAFINSTGDLCVEVGDCSDQSASCNPARDAFRVWNSTSIVSYIDFDGDLCLTGNLYENSNP